MMIPFAAGWSEFVSPDIVKLILTILGGAGLGVYLDTRIRRKNIVKKYREFIGYSAWVLQERIDSILNRKIAGHYKKRHEELRDVYASNVVNYTLFLFCQFFAWREIINRELYHFRFRPWRYDSRVLKKLIAVEHWFSTEGGFPDRRFMIFRGEQRVLGDMCIRFNEHTKKYECIDFSSFIGKWKDLSDSTTPCHLSIEQLEEDIRTLLLEKRDGTAITGNYVRLIAIRNSLLELLKLLDFCQSRHPEHRRAYDWKLPENTEAPTGLPIPYRKVRNIDKVLNTICFNKARPR